MYKVSSHFGSRVIALLLALLIGMPASTFASADNAIGTGLAESHGSHLAHGGEQLQPASGHHHPGFAGHGGAHQDHSTSHDHDEEACALYCMACSNHCSSFFTASTQTCFSGGANWQALAATALLARHSDLLYRPPIRT